MYRGRYSSLIRREATRSADEVGGGMATATEWLNGYWYWNQEYTARNQEYFILSKEFQNLFENFIEKYREENEEMSNVEVWSISVEYDINIVKEVELKNTIVKARILYNKLKKFKVLFLCGYETIVLDPTDSLVIIKNLIDKNEPYSKIKIILEDSYSGGLRFITAGAVESWRLERDSILKLNINIGYDKEIIINEVKQLVEYNKDPSKSIKGLMNSWEEFENLCKWQRAQIEGKGLVSYDPLGDASRAFGLWLYDYVQKRGGRDAPRGTQAAAIRELKRSFYEEVTILGKADCSDRQISYWFERTRACVEAAEVLGFGS
jgi:hypothetical protein